MGAPNNTTPNISATRFPSHQLSNGLYVSGHPDQHKDKSPTMSVSQMPYTGGDVKKSGELGKMFDIPVENLLASKLRKSGSASGLFSFGAASSHSGPLASNESSFLPGVPSGVASSSASWQNSKALPNASKSGPLMGTGFSVSRQSSKSGPLTRSGVGDQSGSGGSKNSTPGLVHITNVTVPSSLDSTVTSGCKGSGHLHAALPTTGLITSGPIASGPLASNGVSQKGHSGPLDINGPPGKLVSGVGANNVAINNLSHDQQYSFRRSFPRVILWTVIPLFVMGFIAGAFIIAAVQNAILLIVVAGLFVSIGTLFMWNTCWGVKTVTGFLMDFPHSELGSAKDGQYVKVTGVVTCGSVPLESSYLKVNRCIYTSTGLYEFRSLLSKPARANHHHFTWGVRHLEVEATTGSAT